MGEASLERCHDLLNISCRRAGDECFEGCCLPDELEMSTPNHTRETTPKMICRICIYSRSQDFLPFFSSRSATLIRRSQGILKLSGNNSTSNKQYEAWSHISSCMRFRTWDIFVDGSVFGPLLGIFFGWWTISFQPSFFRPSVPSA